MAESAPGPAISVIIPALNEATQLPGLLDDLDQQAFRDFEVVVADADSSDGTPELARNRGARVVPGGLPARGRNAGAAAARGDFLFFFDADVRLPSNFLEQAWAELDRRFSDLATCEARPITDVAFDKALFRFGSAVTKLTARTEPRATGYCILVTRRLFRRVGGFDESITLGEDHAFSKRAARFRPLHFLSNCYVEVSVRRLNKEGRIAYMLKAVHSDLHRRLIGEIRRDLIDYEFGSYDDSAIGERASIVAKLDRLLLQADESIRKLGSIVEKDAEATGERAAAIREQAMAIRAQFEEIADGLRTRIRKRKR